MNPSDLLGTASILIASDRRRPTGASCRRAISSIYYALFHCLARDCADLLIGSTGAARSFEAWKHPSGRFTKSEVAADIRTTEQVIADYRAVAPKHRRAFAAYVLLKQRTD